MLFVVKISIPKEVTFAETAVSSEHFPIDADDMDTTTSDAESASTHLAMGTSFARANANSPLPCPTFSLSFLSPER